MLLLTYFLTDVRRICRREGRVATRRGINVLPGVVNFSEFTFAAILKLQNVFKKFRKFLMFFACSSRGNPVLPAATNSSLSRGQ